MLIFLLACAGSTPGETEELFGPVTPDPVVVTWPDVAPTEDLTVSTSPHDPDENRVDVQLNEACSSNTATVMDEAGDLDDWVELVNLGSEPIDLTGWTLDDGGAPWTLPAVTLEAGGYRLLWLDNQPEQGGNHATFRLSREGETLSLHRADGSLADRLEVPALVDDQVYGRFPDGGFPDTSLVPTPGNRNPAWSTPGDDTSGVLFPSEAVLDVELFLPDESYAALQADDTSRVAGSLGIGAVWLDDVEVRIKGQWGSRRSIDGKAALKIDIDALVPTRELRGLEALTLNNMVQDASTVHELVGYQLARDMGIPSPRVAHARLFINREYRGIYLHIETVDDVFLSRWFDDPEGNLYEGAYGVDLYADHVWSFDHDEQGERGVDDRSDLLELVNLLDQTPSEDQVAALERLVNVDLTLRTMAFEALIGHWDGYFHAANNYKLYYEPSSGQFTLLPWGIDQTFDWGGDVYGASARLGWWMLDIPSVHVRYNLELSALAVRLRDMDVEGLATGARDRISTYYEEDPYREQSHEAMVSGVDNIIWWSRDRAESVLTDLGL